MDAADLSERQPEGELDLTGGGGCGPYFSGARIDGPSITENRYRRAVRRLKIRVVGKIEKLRSELQVAFRIDLKLFLEGEIQVDGTRTGEDSTARISDVPRFWRLKGTRIEI